MDLAGFVDQWRKNSSGSERSNKDHFILDLCDVLDVPRPAPATGDRARDLYVFEADVLSVHEGGTITTLKADLHKRGCFILEAKQGSEPGDPKVGGARRGTPAWNRMMQEAQGQAISYARSMDDPPPFIVTCDIGYVFELYADFDRSGYYRPFPNAQKHRLFLVDLAQHRETLRALFLDPRSLDPSLAKIKVTRTVAERIAEVAKHLEKEGHAPEAIAKFLMRCLFTMFAEDVELLPDRLLKSSLEKPWVGNPTKFKVGIENLWRTMNTGGPWATGDVLLRFNGGLFTDPFALPLGPDGLELLLQAAKCDWSDVEPAIFGTLLERALSEKERHKLGAHFTPRAYVERLVRPTIEEPIRTEWENVRAAAHKLQADGKVDVAKEAMLAFHQKLCQTRVLDPACGTGNFLYVTLNIFKQIESEVLAVLTDLGETQEQLLRVTPKQFLGIEVKPWAKEIAELVLWIGYLQWHYRTHRRGVPPPEPVLQDFHNIECRDAMLAWDDIELVRDEKGKPVTRWDGETYKRNAVTGEMVPDEKGQVAVERYVKPKKAEWPKADFIVGNPPFMGNKRMRMALGDSYVEALREAHDDVPDAADLVMYWWNKAATVVREGEARRLGLITTNSITQTQNRRVVSNYVGEGKPLSLIFAVPDHPWVDSTEGAAVRVSMTAVERGSSPGSLVHIDDQATEQDGTVSVIEHETRGVIGPALTLGADVSSVCPLKANEGISFMGVILVGDGFFVDADEAREARAEAKRASALAEYVSGTDLARRARGREVLDFSGWKPEQILAKCPAAYQLLLERVKPHRDVSRDQRFRDIWWEWGRPRPEMRAATHGLPRYIATTRTSKHRVFQFVAATQIVESNVVAVASGDAYVLGVLTSRVHVGWSRKLGATLEDRPHYTNSTIFDPFPFPACTRTHQRRIRDLGDQLDAHRKARQAAHPDLTITGMYNVLEKLRAGAELTDKERDTHNRGLVSALRKIHDDLDTAVTDAYGWPPDLRDEQIFQELVDLNAERAEEEKKGTIRWLRPDFQNPSGKRSATQETLLALEEEEAPPPSEVKPWPKKLADQMVAVRHRVASPGKVFSLESVAAAFKGARKKDVEGILDAFAAFGVLTAFKTAGGKRWRAAGKPA
jgi:hypothetical protein